MNPSWSDAQNWLDILDHIWIGLVVILAATIPSVMAARNHRSLRDIKDQVVNSHPETNLRDDLDRAIAAINDLGNEVRGLRSEMLAERANRRAEISDLQDEIAHRTGKHRRP